jgi:hypothetical protein
MPSLPMTDSVGPQWVSLGGQLLPGVIDIVHVSTTADRLFLNRDLLKNLNFMVGTVLMFLIGLIMNGPPEFESRYLAGGKRSDRPLPVP